MSRIAAPLVEIADPHVSPQGEATVVGHVHAHEHGGAGHDHGDHGHSHAHAVGVSHGHSHAGASAQPPVSFRPPFSLVRLSLVGRLGIAVTLSGAIWAAVLWALLPVGR